MALVKHGPVLGASVAAVAVLHTLSALTMPVRERQASAGLIAVWCVLLALHAAAYGLGERLRERFDHRAYIAAQGALLFGVAVSQVAAPVTLALFLVATAECVVLVGRSWGPARITVGAIGLFVVAAWITSDMYRATTAGLVLAVTGLVAHAIAGLLIRPPSLAIAAGPTLVASITAAGLTDRELDVLRALVSGRRNRDIAADLRISERTVKSHLGSIYQKLGVASRSAAVAIAIDRKLV